MSDSRSAGRPLQAERSAGPSRGFLALGRRPRRELERTLLGGSAPSLDGLVGWEFRGMNTPAWALLLGIRKFVKGFYRAPDGGVYGYNCPVVQDRLEQPWRTKPDDTHPRRFGFYSVEHVDATARDNAYLHAVLLDYSRGPTAIYDPSRGLRDYLVQVAPDDPDLLLGKAYIALGPGRLAVSFFVLERFRAAPAPAPR